MSCSILFALLAVLGQAPDLSFHPAPADKQRFIFDTGAMRGALLVNDRYEGIVSCVDTKTGKEMMKGDSLGLFYLYRLLSTDKRWGDMIWSMPKQAEVQRDGSVRIHWSPSEASPFEIDATYFCSAPDALDLRIQLRLTADVPASRTEIFMGSYFNNDTLPRMYVRPNRYKAGGVPEFLPIEANPYLIGTYCMFPRDLSAAQMIFDGRWQRGNNVVDWAVTRYMAAPIGLEHDEKANRDVLVMADPRHCSAFGMSYHLEPPDGVAAHHSIYICLFGEDMKKDREVSCRQRAVVGGPFTLHAAIEHFDAFNRELEARAQTRPTPDR